MPEPASDALKEFLQELSAMKVHRSAKDGEARKKPLLLLLLVSRIGDGRLSLNRVGFVDVEKELGSLITRFGGRSTVSGRKPEQPFYHLSSSPFWKVQLADHGDIDLRKTPPLRIIRDPKSFATLAPAVFKLLQESQEARAAVVCRNSSIGGFQPTFEHRSTRHSFTNRTAGDVVTLREGNSQRRKT